MGTHLVVVDGVQTFQSDKYPATPAGKVPLSVKDPMAQDLLFEYAQRRRKVDAEFADDLETALRLTGFIPPYQSVTQHDRVAKCELVVGYHIADHDTYIIKDDNGTTGRVSYDHALRRLALAKLRAEVEWEQNDEEELDEEPLRSPMRDRETKAHG